MVAEVKAVEALVVRWWGSMMMVAKVVLDTHKSTYSVDHRKMDTSCTRSQPSGRLIKHGTHARYRAGVPRRDVALNAVALTYMSVTELVSHAEMSALNAVALQNMSCMSVTELVFTQRCPR